MGAVPRHEIYVQPFPEGTGRWQVSFHGGDWARWRGDSKELLYHAIATAPDTPAVTGIFRAGPIFSVAVSAKGAALEVATPQPFVRTFANNSPHTAGDFQTWGLSADGKRILMGQIAGQAGGTAGGAISPEPGRPYIRVAMNWPSGLQKK